MSRASKKKTIRILKKQDGFVSLLEKNPDKKAQRVVSYEIRKKLDLDNKSTNEINT